MINKIYINMLKKEAKFYKKNLTKNNEFGKGFIEGIEESISLLNLCNKREKNDKTKNQVY